MKFIHTGDLHIGKIVNDFSMLKDQKYILDQILELAVRNRVQAVVIAGDVYDRSIPPAEAVEILDGFLTRCSREAITVLCIAGNHDSPERISFAENILDRQGVCLAGSYRRPLRRIRLVDEEGEVEFVLMPFVKPALAGAKNSMEAAAGMLRETENETADGEACVNEERDGKACVSKEQDGKACAAGAVRRVLVTHYFVTDGERLPELSDSETAVQVGGIDRVEASLFDGYDYVALGHIHKPQKIGKRNVYYAGSPLKYSFSEWNQEKSVYLVELAGDGGVRVERVPLKPLHDMRVIRGKLKELMSPEITGEADRNDYIQARLTDEEELIDPIGTLRAVYPNIMQLVLCKNEKQMNSEYESRITGKRKSTPELFEEFYRIVTEKELDGERRQIAEQAFEAAQEAAQDME